MGRTLIIAGVALLVLVAAYYFWGRTPAAKTAMPTKATLQDLIDKGAPRALINEVARRERVKRRIDRINRYGWR